MLIGQRSVQKLPAEYFDRVDTMSFAAFIDRSLQDTHMNTTVVKNTSLLSLVIGCATVWLAVHQC
jgi:hypothetical protein